MLVQPFTFGVPVPFLRVVVALWIVAGFAACTDSGALRPCVRDDQCPAPLVCRDRGFCGEPADPFIESDRDLDLNPDRERERPDGLDELDDGDGDVNDPDNGDFDPDADDGEDDGVCPDDRFEPDANGPLITLDPDQQITRAICPDDDVDLTALDLAPGVRYEVSVVELGGAAGNAVAELLNEAGVVAARADQPGVPIVFTVLLRVDGTESRTLRVRAREPGKTPPFAYIARVTPLEPLFCANEETEPNDLPGQAVRLEAPDGRFVRVVGTVCPSDVDMLALRAPGRALEITVRPAGGAVRLRVLDAAGLTDIGGGGGDTEFGVRVGELPDRALIVLTPESPPATGVRYELIVRALPRDAACIDDDFEPNDDPALATSLSPGADPVSARACPGDIDLYRLPARPVPPGTTFVLFARPLTGASVSVEVAGADGRRIDGPFEVPAALTRLYDAALLAGGTITVRPTAAVPAVGAQYRLGVTVREEPCTPDGFEPNDSLGAARRIASTESLSASICPAADVDVYFVPLATGEGLTVRIGFAEAAPDAQLVVSDDAGGELGRTRGGGTLNVPPGADRRAVYVTVTGPVPDGTSGRYALDLSSSIACDGDGFEPNDAPDQAVDAGLAPRPGEPTGRNASIDARLCPRDADHYTLNLDADRTATLTLRPRGTPLTLALIDAETGADVAISQNPSLETQVLTFSTRRARRLIAAVRLLQAVPPGGVEYTLGSRVEVLPAGCDPDAAEPNDTAAQAAPLAPGESGPFRLCPRDTDVYRFDVPAASETTVRLTALNGGVDGLRLSLLAEDGTSVITDGVPGAAGNTLEAFLRSGGARTLFARLTGTGANPAGTAYRLTLDVRGTAVTCVDDGAEPDDGADAARPLAPARTEQRVLCPADEDWFVVQPEAAADLRVTVLDSTAGAVGVEVLDAVSRVRLAFSAPGRREHVLNVTTPGLVTYLVRVFGPGVPFDGAAYEITAVLTPVPPRCVNDAFEPNDTQSQAAPVPANLEIANLVGCGDDDWFAAAGLPVPPRLRVRVTFVPPQAGVLFDADVIDLDGNRALARFVGQPFVDWSNDAPVTTGRVAVRVRVRGAEPAARPVYGLRIDAQPFSGACTLDGFEPDSTAEQARTYDTGREYTLSACPNDDDWLRVRAGAGDRFQIRASVLPQGAGEIALVVIAGGAVAARTVSSGGGLFLDIPSLGADDPLVQVFLPDAAPPSVGRAYTIRFDTQPAANCPADPFEPNDAPETAAAFPPGRRNDLTLCPGESDWFAVTVPARSSLSVTAAPADAPITLTLSGGVPVPGTPGGAAARIDTANTTSAPAVVRFRVGGDGVNRTGYTLEATTARLPDTCTPDRLEPDDAADRTRSPLAAGTTDGLTLCTADEDWLNVTLAPATRLEVRLRPSAGALAAELYDYASGTLVLDSGRADTAVPLILRTANTLPGPRSLVVRAFGGTLAAVPYGVTVVTTPIAAECRADAFEPNNDVRAAVLRDPGTIADLTLCDTDEDWFAFVVPPGRRLTAVLTADPAEGAAALALIDTNGFTVLAEDTSGAGRKELGADAGGTVPQPYYVRVAGRPGSRNRYTLAAALSDIDPVCVDDAFEENDDLVSASRAAVLRAGTYANLQICPFDADWYRVALPARAPLTATIRFAAGAGDLDLRLLAADGFTELARSAGTGDTETVTATGGTADGTVYLVVTGKGNARNRYNLDLTVGDGPAPCVGDRLEPNDTAVQAARVGVGTLDGLGVCPGDADWFRINVAERDTLSVTAEFTHALGDLDLELYASDGTTLLTAARSRTAAPERVTYRAPAAGFVLARVVGFFEAQNLYRLRVEIQPEVVCTPDRFEPNDTADRAGALFFESGRTDGTWSGLTLCDTNPDWYALEAERGATLVVRALFSHAAGNLRLTVVTPDGRRSVSDTSTTARNLEEITLTRIESSGSVRILVDAAGPVATNYSLFVDYGRPICSPCSADGDCGGAGDFCLITVQRPPFCLQACTDTVNSSDCPDNFFCVTLGGGFFGAQCVPADESQCPLR